MSRNEWHYSNLLRTTHFLCKPNDLLFWSITTNFSKEHTTAAFSSDHSRLCHSSDIIRVIAITSKRSYANKTETIRENIKSASLSNDVLH